MTQVVQSLSPPKQDIRPDSPVAFRLRPASRYGTRKNLLYAGEGDDLLSKLPRSIVLKVFTYLELTDLLNVAIVWKMVIQDPLLEKYHCLIKSEVEKGIPGRKRGESWSLLTNSTEHQLEVRKTVCYQDLLKQESEYADQIQKDLKRTFPENILIQQPIMQNRLLNVLHAYSVFKKDIGYCQGMSSIVGLLCFHMDEEDAFWTIVQLSDNYGLSEVWKPDLPGLHKCFYVLEKLEEKFLPKVSQHLQAQQLLTSMYATTWFVTVFLYNVPFTNAMRIWDIFLYEGFSFLYALGLAFLEIFQDEILSMEFEELVCLLQINGSSNNSFDFEQLLKKANLIKADVKEAAKVFEEEYTKKKKPRKSRKDKKSKSSKKEKKEREKSDGEKLTKHKKKTKKKEKTAAGEEKVKKERTTKDEEKKVKKEKKERRSKTLTYADKSLMVPPIIVSGQAC